MSTESFFSNLGQIIGNFIRWLYESLSGLLGGVPSAIGDFFDGLAHSSGISPTLFNILFLLIGLWFLYASVRAFLRRAVIWGIIDLLLGLWVLSWLID